MKQLILQKNHQKRLLQGHRWIYSNEINTKRSSLKDFSQGELVEVCDSQGQTLGIAYVNPHSLITARLLTDQSTLPDDWIKLRIQNALRYREQFYDKPYYRLVYGESDALPGLVIDRYDQDFVIQINTAGMEQQIEAIYGALIELFQPNSIWLRADSSMRELENLPKYAKELHGELPEYLTIIENDVRFEIPREASQKTGWFYDHRENRAFLKSLAQGKRVLDVFSYAGGWGIQAAMGGAANVTCVDSSHTAMEFVQHNARLNQVQDNVHIFQSDAFEALKLLKHQEELFDVVVLDPPAFIKRRKDFKQGLTAYYRANQQALKLLQPGGILVSASCSHHLSEHDLQEVIQQSLAQAGRTGRLILRGHPGFDHPIHPAMPETYYLKAFFIQLD
ncbi:class I SAM-dependent rRNA methyltransferase [Legionella impletisoli]|uniref:SAM-dependent methyltransferase n=1 Tax=Legionella impletisoli TaxID=343510 RepID=A0A917N8K9_9GAMM|nr:class I SAM-dependent rRNA methyltransferase [Legionella impletisoli]GGI78097.1 SAM-dependent methyltransferase [Legionella impletisoli]